VDGPPFRRAPLPLGREQFLSEALKTTPSRPGRRAIRDRDTKQRETMGEVQSIQRVVDDRHDVRTVAGSAPSSPALHASAIRRAISSGIRARRDRFARDEIDRLLFLTLDGRK
jgi:hypothetical protein